MLKACFHKGGKKKERCERSEFMLSLVEHSQNGTREVWKTEQHYLRYYRALEGIGLQGLIFFIAQKCENTSKN